MKLGFSTPIGVLFALVLCGAASAQPIQFQSADGINNTPVSAANPLPVTGGGGGGGGAVTMASGAVASGAYASGSIASGALASGAGTDGWDVTKGAKADSACGTDNGTCSLLALIKRLNQNLTTLNSTASGAVAAGTSTIGGTVPRGDTTSGATGYGLQSAASTNSTSVATGARTLVGINLESTSTTVMYLRMYDAGSAPTCSSATNFTRTWAIPPAASAGLVGGITVHLPVQGVKFSNGIAFCITGGASSTDNTNATTGGLVNLDYF